MPIGKGDGPMLHIPHGLDCAPPVWDSRRGPQGEWFCASHSPPVVLEDYVPPRIVDPTPSAPEGRSRGAPKEPEQCVNCQERTTSGVGIDLCVIGAQVRLWFCGTCGSTVLAAAMQVGR